MRRRGFTLLEVLIALALLTGLITAAVTLITHVGSAWAAQADDPVLDRHADALDRLIRRMFSESGYTFITIPTADRVSEEGAILGVTPPPDLPWFELAPGGRIEARIAFTRDTGLTLRWNTRRERTLGTAPVRLSRISPWVVDAALLVRADAAAEWTDATPGRSESTAVEAASPESHRALRLELEHLGRHRTLIIPLPRKEDA